MNPIKKIIYQYGIPFVGRICNGRNKFVNVIYYHDIVQGKGNSFQQTNMEVFKRQMHYIASHGYTTLRFDDLKTEAAEKYNPKTIVIAFDDGWKSNYTEIYDFMKSLGIKYSIYLAVKEIGTNPDYLTWEQVRQMHEEGLVGFGAHTYTHPDMSDISKIDPELEFTKADAIFEKELGYKPLDFCYPFGNYSEESNEYISSKLNYHRIYTSRYMYSYRQNGKLIFGRCGISNDESFGVFKAKLKGYFNVWRTIFG
ncbi:polysaccharide deacetylase family protein [Bacteroides ovatus]|uniref:polysaccharide deacetylase family protein n=1 Tax=Bacteroides ovatus TaxID=28116 RepID=UPI0018C9EDDB|nr:polysaccharide deacetylase family protein [Bacteroides ovatus]MBG9220331.1 polysaccharide deacetylase family protein [Bacteroides ovatus]MBG9233471.1 polysaccharide deacetylase family protein [Bacteroides ovatus]